MKLPEYKVMNVNEVKPNTYNPNEMSLSMVDFLANEIKKVGFLQPVLINKDNTIIDGEHRWLAAKQAGLTEIPVFQIKTHLSDAKLSTVNMNQIKGSTNPILLAELIVDLGEEFTKEEIADSLKMSTLEVESYAELLKMPNLDDLEEITEFKKETITCPHCGKEFEL